METLFKKYFWVLNLVVLTAVAWLIAQTVMDYAKGRYLTVPAAEPEVAMASEAPSFVEKANKTPVAQVLTDRRPFNVEPPKGEEVKEPEACKPACENKTCGDDGCGGSCGTCKDEEVCKDDGTCAPKDDEASESELNIELQGTLSSPIDPTVRIANVLANGEPMLVLVGTDIQGQAKVIDIQPKMLYLQEGEKLTYISLWSDRSGAGKGGGPNGAMRTGGPQVPAQPDPGLARPNPGESAPADNAPPPPKNQDLSEFVKKESETSYRISRQMLDEQLQDLTQLGMQARVIPNYRNGKYEGFKLVGVRPGSLYRAIGIRSGDIVRSINGKAINSPNKAMELFSEFKNANSLSMEVERRGQIETLQYAIE
jgi:general secretion pathway protein C